MLVFAERKATVDRLERMLKNKRIPALGIHGDKSQMQRDTTIRRSVGAVYMDSLGAQAGATVPLLLSYLRKVDNM